MMSKLSNNLANDDSKMRRNRKKSKFTDRKSVENENLDGYS